MWDFRKTKIALKDVTYIDEITGKTVFAKQRDVFEMIEHLRKISAVKYKGLCDRIELFAKQHAAIMGSEAKALFRAVQNA